MRRFFTNTPAAGFAIWKSKIDRIAALCFLIPGISGTFYRQRFIAGIAGTEIYAVFVLRIQAKCRLSALFESAAVLPFLFPVGSEDSAAAIKNAGAFAPVAYADFVISRNQAFGIVLLPDFRFAPF